MAPARQRSAARAAPLSVAVVDELPGRGAAVPLRRVDALRTNPHPAERGGVRGGQELEQARRSRAARVAGARVQAGLGPRAGQAVPEVAAVDAGRGADAADHPGLGAQVPRPMLLESPLGAL